MTDVSEALTAAITALITEAVSAPKTSVSTRLHGATSQYSLPKVQDDYDDKLKYGNDENLS
jgi:hypothetical protein